MKEHRKILVVIVLVVLLTLTTVLAGSEITVLIDGEKIEFEVPPQIMNGRTMVPFRAIFENLGAEVDWDNDTRTAIGIRNDIVVEAQIGNTTMRVDGVEKTMDVAPVIVGGRTLVPARFVAEAYNCDVKWDNDTRTVIIMTDSAELYDITNSSSWNDSLLEQQK